MTAASPRNSLSLDDESAIELLRHVCEQLELDFSANDARQSWADNLAATRNPTDEVLLAAIAKRQGLRLRVVSGTIDDVMRAVSDYGPVILQAAQQDSPLAEEESIEYLVLLSRPGRKRINVLNKGKVQVVSRKWLARNAKFESGGQLSCYLAEPLMAAGRASSFDHHSGSLSEPLSPFRRLLAFLGPERRDIRVVFVFSIIIGILTLTTPLAVEALVNTIAFGRYLQPLLILSLIVFVFLAFQAGLRVLLAVVVEIMQRRIFVRVVDDLAYRLTRVPTGHLKDHHGPELVNRFFDTVTVQKVCSKLLLETLMLVLQTIIGLTVLAFYHPFLLGYDVGLLFLMTVVMFIIGRGAAKTAKEESQVKYETAAWLQEIVRHPMTFKFNGGLGFAIDRADELAARYVQSRRRHFLVVLRQVSFSAFMQAIAATVLLALGGFLVIEGEMTLGQLVAAELIVTVILGSFAKIGKDLESFYDLLAGMDKLGKLFDLPAERVDLLQLPRIDGPAQIELVDVKLLGIANPIACVVEPGTTLALTGRSGSGKSALIEMIAGQKVPDDGYVLINDYRVDLLSAESLQSQLAFLRDAEIFQGTVDDNLRLGRSEIGSEAIKQTISRLGIEDSITALSKGYNTTLNVSGYPLSSSQAIMLVLGRALIARPGVVLIDGLLDRLTDGDLDDVLSRLDNYRGETTFAIATGRNRIADWADRKIECINEAC